MSYSLEITATALREIDETLDWRAHRSAARAVRWYVEIMEAIRSLADDAGQWGEAPESAWYPGIREKIHGKRRGVYRILFEIRGGTVYVLRVRSGNQNLLEPGEL